MMRWILFGILFYFLFRFFSKVRPRPQVQQQKKNLSEEMVACKQCGTYILKSNALQKGDGVYCGHDCKGA